MGLQSFAIETDKPVYIAGDTVRGHFNLLVSSPIKCKGIKLTVKGKGELKWEEKSHSTGAKKNRRTIKVHHSADLLNHEILAWKTDSSGQIEVGEHKLPFEFQLPVSLATSVEITEGFVRYTLTGSIDSMFNFDKNAHLAISVVARVDLATNSAVQARKDIKKEKTLCFLCCASDPLNIHFSLDRTGFVPGEKLSIKGEINNPTGRAAKPVIKLTQTQIIRASNKTRKKMTLVSEGIRPAVEAGDEDEFIHDLLVPPLPPSAEPGVMQSNEFCSYSYTLKISVGLTGAIPITASIPITIGTIPVASSEAAKWGWEPRLMGSKSISTGLFSHANYQYYRIAYSPDAPKDSGISSTPQQVRPSNPEPQQAFGQLQDLE